MVNQISAPCERSSGPIGIGQLGNSRRERSGSRIIEVTHICGQSGTFEWSTPTRYRDWTSIAKPPQLLRVNLKSQTFSRRIEIDHLAGRVHLQHPHAASGDIAGFLKQVLDCLLVENLDSDFLTGNIRFSFRSLRRHQQDRQV